MHNDNARQTILSTTAALWFQHDARRLAQFQRRPAGALSLTLAEAPPATQPVSRPALTTTDLLPRHSDLTEQNPRELRKRFHARATA